MRGMNSAAWDRLVSSQIDPGHSLEEYDIFESVRGVSSLVPRRRFVTPLDQEMGALGKVYLHTCSKDEMWKASKEFDSLGIERILSLPATHDWNGRSLPEGLKNHIVMYGDTPSKRVWYHGRPIPEIV